MYEPCTMFCTSLVVHCTVSALTWQFLLLHVLAIFSKPQSNHSVVHDSWWTKGRYHLSFVCRSVLSLQGPQLTFVCRSVLSLQGPQLTFVCRSVLSLQGPQLTFVCQTDINPSTKQIFERPFALAVSHEDHSVLRHPAHAL